MKITIFIDPRLGPMEKRHSAYVWHNMAQLIGLSALITDRRADMPSISSECFNIYYGHPLKERNNAFDLYVPHESIDGPFHQKWFGNIPVLFCRNEPVYLQYEKQLGFDPISTSFELLSASKEFHSSEIDYLSRYPEELASTSTLGITRMPLINIWANLINDHIARKFGRKVNLPLWGKDKTFAVVLSHDVDSISRHSLSMARNGLSNALWEPSLRRKLKYLCHGLKSLMFLPTKYMRQYDPLWFFDRFIQLERKYGVKSTFFALPPRADATHPLDWLYSYDEKVIFEGKWMKLKNAFLKIAEAGWEIGLHAGLKSFRQADILCEQKKRLEKVLSLKIDSIRQHYLRFSIDRTWKIQSEAGFRYDSTYGFNRGIGFRAAVCLPYQPFSHTSNRPIDIWELPLTIQDNPLFSSKARPLGDAINLLSEVRKVGGAATLLWHTNAVWEKKYPGWIDVYDKIIDWALAHDAKVGSVQEIMSWWHMRRKKIRIAHHLHID